MKTIYLCQGDFEGILTGIYKALTSGKKPEDTALALAEEAQDMELFTEYVSVAPDAQAAQKAAAAVCRRVSQEGYERLFAGALSWEPGRAQAMYRFVQEGFRWGGRAVDMLQLPGAYEIFRLSRSVYNESHHLTEFLRFSQNSQGVLVARIGPRNDVLVLLASHFSDRLPGENWIIYDEKRRKALLHPAGEGWMVLHGAEEQAYVEGQLASRTDQEVYEELWRTFHQAVAVQERFNPRCQRNLLPLRFRPYMTEFQS